MKVGERVRTNKKCDMPNIEGVVIKASETGVCGIVKLDTGINILTMDYTVDLID